MMLLASSLFNLTSSSNSKLLISSTSLPCFSFHPQLKNNSTKGCVLLPLNCTPRDDISDPDKLPFSSSSTSRSPAVAVGNSTYNWCALIGGLGFVDTTYLSYLKLTGSDPFCPVGSAGSCTHVLTSDYASVFGIPLPLIGMSAYGTVFLLGLTLGGWKLPVKIDETDGRLLLLSITSSMAVASAYFLYILSTQFGGASSCSYCLGSAIFSFSLFFIILKELGLEELRKVVVLPLFTAAIALGVLGNSYSSLPPNSPRSEAVNIPYYETMITTESTPFTISLAKHLHSIGAKMYGAFWCTHCQEQKEMFGREAAKLLDYVECFPDGVKKGTSLIPACANIGIEGFPTWIINGEVLGGEKTIEELATLSGFQGDDDVLNMPEFVE